MASSRLTSLALLFVACAAVAQAPTRVRGTVESFDGKALVVKGAAPIRVGEKTEIVYTQPITLADIKPGDFLGVTSRQAADGKLTAYEVRRFPKPVNPGHRPFDGGANQTMTNATVGTVAQASGGRELILTYDGGSQRIAVPQDASVSELVPGKASQLVPGARVNLTHGADQVALRIQVSAPQ
ncbi:MAG TPA: hypothetical protein VF110_10505 [Burkholderiales bacterium]|jgi:hypothetical protein